MLYFKHFAQANAHSVMLLKYRLTLHKPVNCHPTMSSEQQAHNYAQYLIFSLHILRPSIENHKKISYCKIVSVPALEFVHICSIRHDSTHRFIGNNE